MTPTPDAPAGVSLLSPDRQCEIPLQFTRNSLAHISGLSTWLMMVLGFLINLLLHHRRAL